MTAAPRFYPRADIAAAAGRVALSVCPMAPPPSHRSHPGGPDRGRGHSINCLKTTESLKKLFPRLREIASRNP